MGGSHLSYPLLCNECICSACGHDKQNRMNHPLDIYIEV